jgi:hypothetical protein
MMESLGNPRSERTDRDQVSGIDAEPRERPVLTSRRRAVRNAAGMLAIVAAMFMVFYGINMQHTRSVATTPAGVPETTGQR